MMKTKIFVAFATGALALIGCDSDDGNNSGNTIGATTDAGTDDDNNTSSDNTNNTNNTDTGETNDDPDDSGPPDTGTADTGSGDANPEDTGPAVCDPECPDGEECVDGTCFPAGDTDGTPMVGEACEAEGEFCLTDQDEVTSCINGLLCAVSCLGGTTCPDNMSCNSMSVCVYEKGAKGADPAYGDPAAGCPDGSIDLSATPLELNVCAPACDPTAPNVIEACPMTGSGTAIGACTLSDGMGSMIACG